MNKRPGNVIVTTEVAMCSFCGRPRTLRNEQHQLGSLVRTIVTCETCHRTLSSSVSVANAEPAQEEPVAAAVEPVPAEPAAKKTTAKATPKRKPPTAGPKPASSKSRTEKKAR